jgi:hypothetical protein
VAEAAEEEEEEEEEDERTMQWVIEIVMDISFNNFYVSFSIVCLM